MTSSTSTSNRTNTKDIESLNSAPIDNTVSSSTSYKKRGFYCSHIATIAGIISTIAIGIIAIYSSIENNEIEQDYCKFTPDQQNLICERDYVDYIVDRESRRKKFNYVVMGASATILITLASLTVYIHRKKQAKEKRNRAETAIIKNSRELLETSYKNRPLQNTSNQGNEHQELQSLFRQYEKSSTEKNHVLAKINNGVLACQAEIKTSSELIALYIEKYSQIAQQNKTQEELTINTNNNIDLLYNLMKISHENIEHTNKKLDSLNSQLIELISGTTHLTTIFQNVSIDPYLNEKNERGLGNLDKNIRNLRNQMDKL